MKIKDLPLDEQAYYCSWHNFSLYDDVETADKIIQKNINNLFTQIENMYTKTRKENQKNDKNTRNTKNTKNIN